MNRTSKLALLINILFVVSTCGVDKREDVPKKTAIDTMAQQAKTGRWYTLEQQQAGLKVFAKNCATCHGDKAQETVDWKTPTASGHYPPPPLNGTAHAWHHPLTVLQMVIRKGGEPMGGVMPAWEGVLSENEITAAIAAFQSYWPNEVYQRWLEIDQQASQ